MNQTEVMTVALTAAFFSSSNFHEPGLPFPRRLVYAKWRDTAKQCPMERSTQSTNSPKETYIDQLENLLPEEYNQV